MYSKKTQTHQENLAGMARRVWRGRRGAADVARPTYRSASIALFLEQHRFIKPKLSDSGG